jgi:phage tail-like protein
MTDETDPAWPMTKFSFAVDIDGVGTDLPFQEVSGLDVETQIIEYRRGDAKFSPIKMPGIQRSGSITLKKGVFVKDSALLAWADSVKRNTTKRSRVTIRLLDENRTPVMTWVLTNARPTKFASADLNAAGNEVAVETLELAHEGLTIENK